MSHREMTVCDLCGAFEFHDERVGNELRVLGVEIRLAECLPDSYVRGETTKLLFDDDVCRACQERIAGAVTEAIEGVRAASKKPVAATDKACPNCGDAGRVRVEHFCYECHSIILAAEE